MPGSASAYECPLCLGEEFVDFKGRGTVRCATCGSIPRTRIAWLLLRDYARLRPGARVAHFAPEPTLAMRLLELCGAGYEPYDLDPGRYQARMPFVKVAACDLCTDLGDFAAGAYDAIVHNHVMEHLPCNHVMVLLQMQDLLKTGGVQVFSVPVTRGRTRSDMDPGLLAAQRTRHFGQWDHMVKFGADDHDVNLGRVFGQTNDSYHLEDLLDETALRRANIPVAQWRPSGSTVFAVRKR